LRILFVVRGKENNQTSVIVKNQANSLINEGLSIDIYKILGSGIMGYIQSIPDLRKLLRHNAYDIIHGHYFYSGIVASLSGFRPVVVSLMGSDVYANAFQRFIINLFSTLFWKETIVKSKKLKKLSGIKKAIVIPNGVDISSFIPIDKKVALTTLGWDVTKQHILFASSPSRPEKNYTLAQRACDKFDKKLLELHFIKDVPNKDMPFYYNAADVILLTSFYEGSPNVIKEAMACNTPIVSTDVGDVKVLISDCKGCYITNYNTNDVYQKLNMALSFNGKTNGRTKIANISSEKVAKEIIALYNIVVKKK
jgi:glycosyltransferase involved in cell wall biosynthesis